MWPWGGPGRGGAKSRYSRESYFDIYHRKIFPVEKFCTTISLLCLGIEAHRGGKKSTFSEIPPREQTLLLADSYSREGAIVAPSKLTHAREQRVGRTARVRRGRSSALTCSGVSRASVASPRTPAVTLRLCRDAV
jgi:hypothetical protein